MPNTPKHERVCPWWMGYLLASPIRRLFENPEKIVEPYVKSGMTVLEIGPGMGFFTLPMARMVGDQGKIICVDIQDKMLESLNRRAKRASLADRIVTRLATSDSLNISDFAGQVDSVILIAVVHEVPDQKKLFEQIHQAMKPDALMLISEPKGHVTAESFEKMLKITKSLGFGEVSRPVIKGGISVVLKKS
jgi:ubiquinone/menaquinone biosynthesis C-methylase UbiE